MNLTKGTNFFIANMNGTVPYKKYRFMNGYIPHDCGLIRDSRK